MCGILGVFSTKEIDINSFKILAKQISHRGKSGYGLFVLDKEVQYCKTFDSINFKEVEKKFKYGTVSCSSLQSLHFTPQPLINTSNNSSLLFNGELYEYDLNSSTSDTVFLQKYLDSFSTQHLLENISDIVDTLYGDYAICYQREEYVFLIRDNLGVKPLWYHHFLDEEKLVVYSQKTNLFEMSEVNPREIIVYNRFNNSTQRVQKNFYTLANKTCESESKIQEKVWSLLVDAIKKRIPKDKSKKVGILFSGGIDSTVIALILKQLGVEFTCYSAKLSSNSLEEADDFIFAKEISEKYNLNFKYKDVNINELEKLTKDVISIISDTNYIKVSVALPFLASCRLAQEDEIDIMFSGLGSEEIFAGYRRHKQAENVNEECLEGLKILHQRDLYRDDVITMSCTQELRVPFLDTNLISYCLNLPAKYKLDVKKVEEIKDEVYKKPYLNSLVQNKIILRNCAKRFLNLEDKYANRLKKAAQYGSKFDKGLLRLSKNKELNKQDYLDELNETIK